MLPFTVEEGKKVIRTNPQYLSLNELYQIALSYPQDSPEYEEVFMIALRYYPDDPVANNNMAAIALRKNDSRRLTSISTGSATSPVHITISVS